MFIEQGGKVVDSEVSEPLNQAELKKLLTFAGANNQQYSLFTETSVKTVKYNNMFSFYTTSQIKYDDVTNVQIQLDQVWSTLGKEIFRIFIPM